MWGACLVSSGCFQKFTHTRQEHQSELAGRSALGVRQLVFVELFLGACFGVDTW